MKNLIKVFRIIALIALIGFSMTACPTDAGGGGGSGGGSGGGRGGGGGGGGGTGAWKDITSLYQLRGTWYNSSTNTTPADPYTYHKIGTLEIPPLDVAFIDTTETTLTFNTSDGTTGTVSFFLKETISFPDISDDKWASLKSSDGSWTKNNSNHTFTTTEDGSANISLSDLHGSMINQAGTQFKILVHTTITTNGQITDEYDDYVIFTKQ
jgi:hypothetical protein